MARSFGASVIIYPGMRLPVRSKVDTTVRQANVRHAARTDPVPYADLEMRLTVIGLGIRDVKR
jgi:hypothetical protein